MAEQFYTILTNTGKAKIANSVLTGTKVNLTTLKVGDSNGAYYNPAETQTNLVHSVYQCNITSVQVDTSNPNWITITSVIPSDQGGFFIRECGVFDDGGNLIAIGKYPETYKPQASDGSVKELYIKMTLEVSNATTVELKIDPTVILATKNDVNVLSNSVNNSIANINEQLSDMDYQVAGGTATAITLTTQTLRNGYAKTFIASANNSGVATTINTKKLYKPGTTTAPKLIAGKAYTVWYNASGDNGNGCFFIKASATGTALASQVLKDVPYSNEEDTDLVGTLDLSLLVSANIKSGVTINGVAGKTSVVDTADATAVASDIVLNKTAYKNGAKITGTATIASLGGKKYVSGAVDYIGTNGVSGTSLTLPFTPTIGFVLMPSGAKWYQLPGDGSYSINYNTGPDDKAYISGNTLLIGKWCASGRYTYQAWE